MESEELVCPFTMGTTRSLHSLMCWKPHANMHSHEKHLACCPAPSLVDISLFLTVFIHASTCILLFTFSLFSKKSHFNQSCFPVKHLQLYIGYKTSISWSFAFNLCLRNFYILLLENIWFCQISSPQSCVQNVWCVTWFPQYLSSLKCFQMENIFSICSLGQHKWKIGL